MGITSRKFFGQKRRVVWYCHSCKNSMQWQRAVRSRLYSEWAREVYCNPFTLVHLSNLILLSVNTSSYNQWPNCWYIVLEWGLYLQRTKHSTPTPLSSIQSWGVCCFLQVAWTVAQHYMEGMGKEKLHFSLLELANCQKGPLGKSVSTYFVTN